MKVLFISPNFNTVCGRSRMVFNLIKGFLKNNIGCEFMTNGGDALNKFDELDVKVHIEDINPEAKNTFGFLKARRKLSNITARSEFDIVHVHHRYHDILLSSLTSKSFKSVHTVHSYLSGKRSFGFNADLIVPVSFFIKEHLINDHKVDENKIAIVYNFIDPIDYKTNLPSSNQNSEINLLTIGRFHPEKDVLTQLRAMTLLKDINCKLTICGDGDEREMYENFISENSINAELISKVQDVSDIITNSNICLMSSVNEPFGLFVLESGLFRKPFIGTDSGGIKELIERDKTGYLFEPGNHEELANVIREVVNNLKQANQFGENLHKEIIDHFTIDRGIKDYIECHKNILDE